MCLPHGTRCKRSAGLQIDVVNEMQLLTAKPVTYLVNLSEKDFIRKKNKWCVVLNPGIWLYMATKDAVFKASKDQSLD